MRLIQADKMPASSPPDPALGRVLRARLRSIAYYRADIDTPTNRAYWDARADEVRKVGRSMGWGQL